MYRTKKNHTVKDGGSPFIVDPYARKVTVPYAGRVIGVVGDNCSEKVTFQIPNTIDGHDMPSSTRKYVAWRNVDGEPGTDELAIIEEGEEYCLYSWLVRDATTVAKGLVEFSLHFECDDPETGKLIYRWGTYTCTDCEILDSVNTVMGAFAAIYINGETLVFADYTPVRNESLDLTSCVVPEGVVEITELGTHDVGRYAYAEVKAVYEQPKIEVSDATIKATANGLTTTTPLDIPGRAKKVTVTFTGTVPAYIDYQELQEDGSLADAKLITYMEENPPTSMTVVAGSFMKFSNILGGKVTVDCPMYPSAIRGTVDSGTSQSTLFWVPSYAESVNIIFK